MAGRSLVINVLGLVIFKIFFINLWIKLDEKKQVL